MIPNVATGLSATWAGETESVTATDPALGELSLVPRRLFVITDVSRQLLTQTPQLFDSLVFPDMVAALAAAVDKAAIQGSGGTQPLGITNTAGVVTQSGTSLAASGIRAMQRGVLANNGGPFSFIAAPTVAEALAGRAAMVSGAVSVWVGALDRGELAGSPAFGTSNCPSATLVGGDFSRLVVASFFSGIEVDTDESGTRFNQFQVGVRATLWCDVVVATPGAFAVATSIT